MANPRNPLTRRFASFGARLIRFTFIIAAYMIGGNLSASLTRLNRQMTRNDAQLAPHPPTDATTQIPNPLPDGAITAHVSSHAGAPAGGDRYHCPDYRERGAAWICLLSVRASLA